jgi:biotin operon repressor
MPTKLRSWSFADDRRLMQLADSLRSLEAIADLMNRTRENVAKRAKRLGLSRKFARAMNAKMK